MSKGGDVVGQIVKAYTFVVIWMGVSISVILFNKWLLAFSGFPFPITLTMWHMSFCSAVGFVCVRVLGITKSHNLSLRDYTQRVLPIGVLYAASLWLSNSAYLYLSVSFIQMTKSLMPGLVYACGVAWGTEQYEWSSAANMALIAFGVVVCALGEANLVMKGLVQQLVALVFEAARLTLVQAARLTLVQILMAARGLAMNPLQSLYYVSPACFLCLLVPFFALEFRTILTSPPTFYPSVLLANALAAFALNLAVFLLIGKTSALTMNIAGVIKDWMLIFFSFYVFHAPVTRLNLFGYAFCCTGVGVYNYQKLQLLKKKALQKQKEADSSGKADMEGGRPLLANGGSNGKTEGSRD
ncbi:hypothetical protein COHA_000702 [Chlorella ohadii]|uniref:Sugar phosphate transporter domain-containing protein n=1 Tax=Chlorella ohadii TaxID=2649997 RepID=A0AAD5E2R9_9CHLO|nr:hypothetical protein COHA_000702 [Chlorella ohadii]